MTFCFYRKKNLSPLFIFSLALFFSFNSYCQTDNFNKGEILFQLKENQSLQEAIIKIGTPGKLELVSKPWNIYRYIFDDKNLNARSSFTEYSKINEINGVQQNHHLTLRELIPNDSLFNTQWALNNIGQLGGIPKADINITETWDYSTGGLTIQNDTIVVAVVDNGFELNHPDLNFWKNYLEIAGNGLDDDGNGFIDDFDGWNFYTKNEVITPAKHGTHVSGIIAAKGNNKIGISGINWNLKIMPIQGSGTTESTVIAAYSYIFEQRKLYNDTKGAKGTFVVAINSSFGVDKGLPSNYPLWCGIYDSLGKIGILNAAATANINYDIDAVGDIPTACPSDYLIAVTSTTNNDKKYNSAAYGLTSIDIGAPGIQINSTILNGLYGYDSGTSMASPHAAGAIALLYSVACEDLIKNYKIYPDSVSKLIKSFIIKSTDLIPDLKDKSVSGGRLNINRAVKELNNYCESINIKVQNITNQALRLKSIYPNPSSTKIVVKAELMFLGETKIFIFNVLGQVIREENLIADQLKNFETSFDITALASGIYFLCINQNDKYSNRLKLIVK